MREKTVTTCDETRDDGERKRENGISMSDPLILPLVVDMDGAFHSHVTQISSFRYH